MPSKTGDIVSILEKVFSGESVGEVRSAGTVVKVGDGICKVFGLESAVYGEVVEFDGGNTGVVMDMDEDYVSVVLADKKIPVEEQEIVKRTGEVFKVPVGNDLIGRVLAADGSPRDAKPAPKAEERRAIENKILGITERQPVREPLETGITVIDALFPIGKGQRELIIGNRSTGKTAIVTDIIINQRGKNVTCVYVSIGKKRSDMAKMLHLLKEKGAMEYSILIEASADDSALMQTFAPYSATTIAEYFMEQGRDVLIIYDDLSNHAIAYRELSLLLRRPPGREAYPGDIFYLHSRLLERACRRAEALGGGSITALPIIQTQGDDISAYIPTNLISITDGQIFFDTSLFNNGIRPAVNVGLSVSRVGGSAQTKAMKSVTGSLKIELAQYEELQAFAQFGTELDKDSVRALERGRRAIEVLKQPLRQTYSQTDEVLMLFLLQDGVLDKLPVEQVKKFCVDFYSYVKSSAPDLYKDVAGAPLSEEVKGLLRILANELMVIFGKREGLDFLVKTKQKSRRGARK